MTSTRRASWRSRVPPALLALLVCVALTAGSCDNGSDPGPGPGPSITTKPTRLTFGVWGNPAEIRAYQEMVDLYNAEATSAHVSIESWPTRAEMEQALAVGAERPDLFMTSRGDLADLAALGANAPLLELLDERGVDYGDGFSRDALLAFSADDELQCMPYGVSPMVMYYNTELIDFDRMAERELPVPPGDENVGWNLEMFQAAADFATRPRKKTTGFYIESSLNGLAPFIYAGGGQVYDDATDPTSLAFSDDGSREALTETLEVLRDPQLTLTEGQLRRATPVEWFMRGKLGMLAGYRSLTPALREDPDLDFDVIPMPVLDGQATVGNITGLCISAKSPDISQTADFLVYAISEEAFGRVARAGYVVPANLEVAASEDFLQPTQMPEHAEVFNDSVRSMVLGPLIDNLPQLEQAVQSSIRLLLTIPVIDDLEALTTQIDEESRVVLDPDFVLETPDPESASP